MEGVTVVLTTVQTTKTIRERLSDSRHRHEDECPWVPLTVAAWLCKPARRRTRHLRTETVVPAWDHHHHIEEELAPSQGLPRQMLKSLRIVFPHREASKLLNRILQCFMRGSH